MNTHSYDVFRRWYIDGRLYYHVIPYEQQTKGIKEIRYIDPRKIRKIREVKKKPITTATQPVLVTKTQNEYFIYNEKGFAQNLNTNIETGAQGLKINADSILHVTSGINDKNNSVVLSHLHKAIKPLNQLRTIEDATLIYRISRAPERRVFYIDVGNLPR